MTDAFGLSSLPASTLGVNDALDNPVVPLVLWLLALLGGVGRRIDSNVFAVVMFNLLSRTAI